MSRPPGRRDVLAGALAAGAAALAAPGGQAARAGARGGGDTVAKAAPPGPAAVLPAKFKLGLVTFNVAPAWDLATILDVCKKAGFAALELRTGHAHQVEPALGAAERQEVRRRIADSGLALWGLGSVCEFHAPDPAVVQKNIEDCRAFCRLAADLGARGVKVRPNALPAGVEPRKTLEQIGKALAACGAIAADLGVEIWVEVHGKGTAHPPHVRTMMDVAAHPSVGVCWNSNPDDVQGGSIKASFDLLKPFVRSCHIHDLWDGYPYRELFGELRAAGYDRVTLMESPGVPEEPGAKQPAAALRLMRAYRALWSEIARA